MPFAALPWHERPLMLSYTLLTVPSLAILAQLIARPASQAKRWLAVGVDQPRNHAPLWFTRQEAEIVSTAHPATDIWLADQATCRHLQERNQQSALRGYGLIHLATHAWSGVAEPQQHSGWRTGMSVDQHIGIALNDGDLLMHDLSQLDLDADVVVISACDSGIGQHYAGEEIVGLAYALLEAGSRALVVSLSKLEDQDALAVMQAFYADPTLRGPWRLAAAQRTLWHAGESALSWGMYCWIGKPAG